MFCSLVVIPILVVEDLGLVQNEGREGNWKLRGHARLSVEGWLLLERSGGLSK